MSALGFFDCSCTIGMKGIMNPGSFYKTDDLLEKMQLYGINKALVYHSMAREYNPVVGNERLMKEIEKYPSLKPVWVVMHHHTSEFPAPDRLVSLLRENDIRAVRMFPGVNEHNYSTAEWNCGELFGALEKEGITLLIGLDQISWNEIYELCTNHPNLKIILTDLTYRIDRNLYSLLKRFNNLYLETIGYKVNNGIEEICKNFGANRFVFGSGMPVYSGGAAVTMVNYLQVKESEKRLIACENLEKLLGLGESSLE